MPRPAAAATGNAGPAPGRSEATRLLCAGVYLDPEFRRRVLRELVEHRERAVAPSLGVDVVPALAHALRCRGRESLTGAWVLGVWVLFAVCDIALTSYVSFTGGYAGSYAVICLLLWSARRRGGPGEHGVYATGGREGSPPRAVGFGQLAPVFRAMGLLLMAVYWIVAVFALTGGDWVGVVFPLLLVVPVWAHRAWFERVAREDLSPAAFRDTAPPGLPAAYQGIGAAIAQEQYSRLTVYDFGRPFLGYGVPYEPWSLAVELKRRQDAPGDGGRLTSRKAVELIMPRLAALRESTAAGSRDRLKDLEVTHLVYLPPPPRRADVDHTPATVDRHIGGSVDEGGEARRYFLRIRVGAWSEQVVVTILVRVHTQGGMLVLEVVPHVLLPVRSEYREIDALGARTGGVRGVVRAVRATPTSSVDAVLSAYRTLAASFRDWQGEADRRPAEGPAVSVRELAVSPEVSLFQEMDVSRYVKTVRDRIASGVTEALRESGYETGEFEQYIVNVNEGGVYIGTMSGGAVASGQGATATARSDGGGAGS